MRDEISRNNFVDIVPQAKRLRISLNVPFEQVVDPKHMCRDIRGLARWGKGDIETGLASLDELDDVMDLVRQAFDWQNDAQE